MTPRPPLQSWLKRPATLPGKRSVFVTLFALFTVLLTGCGNGLQSTSPTAVAGKAFRGTVYGGQQPVGLSQIQMFAISSSGYASASTSLLSQPVMTDASGNFSITGDYTCPSATTIVYLVVTGGNPGLAAGTNNAALAEMGLLGACGQLGPGTFVSVNELTSVAAIYALQPFLTDYAHIGSSPTNVQGLNFAVFTSFSLVDIAGHPSGLPGAVMPSALLNLLADIISACVNSSGSLLAGTPCGRLFTAAAPAGGAVPTDTLTALLDIARNPGHNASALFATIPPNAPYQPSLAAAPADFSLAINFVQPGFRTPQDLAVDPQGTVWVVGSPGTAANGSSTLSSLGVAGFGTSYVQTGHNFGNLAIDPSGNLWLTDTANSQVIELTAAGKRVSPFAFTGGGITGPGPIAFDPAGNAWVSNDSATVSELSPSGTALSPAAGYPTGAANGPVALAIDAQSNVWSTDSAGNAVTKLSSAGKPVNGSPFTGGGLSSPFGLAFDASGNAFVANRNAASLTRFAASGTPPATTTDTGLGLAGPVAVAVDGQGAVWVVNVNSGTLSVLGGSSGVASSTSAGYASAFLTNPYKLAIDGAGNVWVTNLGSPVAGSGIVTQIVGAAAPVVTPLAAAVQTGTLAQRP